MTFIRIESNDFHEDAAADCNHLCIYRYNFVKIKSDVFHQQGSSGNTTIHVVTIQSDVYHEAVMALQPSR